MMRVRCGAAESGVKMLLRTKSGQLKRISGQLKGIYVLFTGHKLRVS
jgi:hypothetical protein